MTRQTVRIVSKLDLPDAIINQITHVCPNCGNTIINPKEPCATCIATANKEYQQSLIHKSKR